jgi:hypothetical protein
MKRVEFSTELQDHSVLHIPNDIATQIEPSARARVIIEAQDSNLADSGQKSPPIPPKVSLYGMVGLAAMSVVQLGPIVKLTMQVVISLAILSAGLYVVLGKRFADDHDRMKWAYGGIAAVLSFWLGKSV